MTIVQPGQEPAKRKSTLYRVSDCRDEMCRQFHQGKEKGSTTYIDDIDKCWKWRNKEFNIWTGYMNEGKSLILRYLAIIKAVMDGWKFVFSAPEDFPPSEFFDDMIHTIAGTTTDKDSQYQVPEDFYLRAMDILEAHIFFVYMEPGSTIADTLAEFRRYMKEEIGPMNVAIIDPLIKFARPKDISDRDDIYAQHVTTLCTDFCRKENLSLNLVMHQLTPRMLENGYYPKPSAYFIKGGGTWADGVDNILYAWRPTYAKDKFDPTVEFGSQKIKKQKLVGVPQAIQMRFDRKSNRYTDPVTGRDMFDFDEVVRKIMAKK